MINTIVFDLDGTLLNTLEDLKDSVNFALERQGYPLRDLGEIRSFVGNGIRLLMERAVPENTPAETFEICFKDFCDYYKIHMEDKTAPYDGINDMLTNIKKAGFKTAIVTNKADFAAQDLCKRMFGENIDFVVGSSDDRPNKPAPDGVFYALEKLNSKIENTVFVGDADTDILTAKNANLPSIGVLWGFRDREVIEEAGAEYIVESVNDLEKLLISLK
ncbi:MAG: HAD family hydrolase [Clostridia bacterium]|nr:HAD family hydrolase [Clostridia bacterium]